MLAINKVVPLNEFTELFAKKKNNFFFSFLKSHSELKHEIYRMFCYAEKIFCVTQILWGIFFKDKVIELSLKLLCKVTQKAVIFLQSMCLGKVCYSIILLRNPKFLPLKIVFPIKIPTFCTNQMITKIFRNFPYVILFLMKSCSKFDKCFTDFFFMSNFF